MKQLTLLPPVLGPPVEKVEDCTRALILDMDQARLEGSSPYPVFDIDTYAIGVVVRRKSRENYYWLSVENPGAGSALFSRTYDPRLVIYYHLANERNMQLLDQALDGVNTFLNGFGVYKGADLTSARAALLRRGTVLSGGAARAWREDLAPEQLPFVMRQQQMPMFGDPVVEYNPLQYPEVSTASKSVSSESISGRNFADPVTRNAASKGRRSIV